MLADGGAAAVPALAPLSAVLADGGAAAVPAPAPLSAVLADGGDPACLALAPLSAVLADGGAAAFLAAAPAFAVLADGGAAAGHALMFASAVRAFLLLPSPLRLRCCWPCRHVSRCWPLLATAPSFSASANLTAKRRVLVLQLRNFLLEHGDVLSAWPALVGLGHAQVFCRTCTR